MSQHIGEEYDGIISGFTQQNIFVELPNTVEGAMNVAYMDDDYYSYNETEMIMRGDRTGNIFSLGDKVRIRVLRADKVERIIDFELVKKL